jgi:hypothetical protein
MARDYPYASANDFACMTEALSLSCRALSATDGDRAVTQRLGARRVLEHWKANVAKVREGLVVKGRQTGRIALFSLWHNDDHTLTRTREEHPVRILLE